VSHHLPLGKQLLGLDGQVPRPERVRWPLNSRVRSGEARHVGVYKAISDTYTLDQLLDAFKPVVEKLQAIRNKLPYPNEDARQIGLYGMQATVVAFGLTIHAITGNGLRSHQRNSEEVLGSFENYAAIQGEPSISC
jgi:hypothetical protein